MRWRCAVFLLGLAAMRPAASQIFGPAACFSPLEPYCASHACPTYGESIAALERLDESAVCFQARAGTCGELKVVRQVSPTSTLAYYFGADDRVVGVTTASNAIKPPESCDWRHYGTPLRCTYVLQREYCKHPVSRLDPRMEIKGRIVEADTEKPLAGAVVISVWYTELPPSPAEVLLGLTVGGHGGRVERRVAQVREAFSGPDGRFVIPAWSEAEQIHRGPITGGSFTLTAFLPGYDPVSWSESEPETFGSMSDPLNKVLRMSRPPRAERVQSFSRWLQMHVDDADGLESAPDSTPRLAVRAVQARAAAMVQQALRQR